MRDGRPATGLRGGRRRARPRPLLAPDVAVAGSRGRGGRRVVGRGGPPVSSTTCCRGARAAPMADGGAVPIPGQGASETSGNGAREVEEHVRRMLARGIGRGRSVAAGFCSALSERTRRKGEDESVRVLLGEEWTQN